jgi:hypothetical protein
VKIAKLRYFEREPPEPPNQSSPPKQHRWPKSSKEYLDNMKMNIINANTMNWEMLIMERIPTIAGPVQALPCT